MATIKINKDNFQEEITNSQIPVIIDFWASWCGPCQMMGPVFEELSNDYEGKLKFAKISTEDDPELANQFQIQGIPCLIITKDGKEIDRITGFAPKDILKQKIDEIMKVLK
ncbi:MAG: thioredoxin [Nanoarchaeota archaeon]|nr:thioredoxin [Nanoarchaeota archaeon]